jgi:hypothetical protein
MPSGIFHFIKARREPITGTKKGLRLVHYSELFAENSPHKLDKYFSEKVPLFYRSGESISNDINSGFFISAIKSSLAKLPTSDSFKESHFGEIVACVFAEEVLGLRRLYSKLTHLTAENSNAYKMDLVMYDPNSDPMKFVFGEVKCSPKKLETGKPPGHDKSCFADIFNSINKYKETDQNFDLTAARDRVESLPPEDNARVRKALEPYSDSVVSYLGFAVIDSTTFCNEEAQVLRTRKNDVTFDVELVCVETFSEISESVYDLLHKLYTLVGS